MPQKDDISKFKKVIDKLPEDKKKLLYKRLRAMPESEREAFISDYIRAILNLFTSSNFQSNR